MTCGEWKSRNLLVAASALCIFAAGCDKDVPERAVGVTRPVNAAISASNPRRVRPDEAEFAELAQGAPHTAGFFLAPGGAVVIQSVRAEEDGVARAFGHAVIGRINAQMRRQLVNSVVIRRARYTFGELARARDWAFDHLFDQSRGVHSLDLDEARNRVTLGVTNTTAGQSLDALRAEIVAAGFDTAMFALQVEAAPSTQAYRRLAPAPFRVASTLESQVDTLAGGIIWGKTGGGVCSIGAVVDYNSTRGFITASHCTSAKWELSVPGDTAKQPYGTSWAIGVETADPGYGTCYWPLPMRCRSSDAAFFTTFGNVATPRGLIARTTYRRGPGQGSGSTTWDSSNPFFMVSSTASTLYYGQEVNKVGYRTGWTYGTIGTTCEDVNQQGDKLSCVYSGDYPQDSGDSGGSVFLTLGDGTATLAGVHAGAKSNGNGYFSSWMKINDDFGGNLTAVRGASLSTPSPSGSLSGTSPVITFGVVSGATRYLLYRQWERFDTGESEGPILIGEVTSGYVDYGVAASAYTGTTFPGFNSPGYIRYQMVALNRTEYSLTSTSIYFRLSQ
jgi:hypothetical protein